MRVLLVSGIFPPDIGGPATHAAEIRAELLERGHVVATVSLTDASDAIVTDDAIRFSRSEGWLRRDAKALTWIVRHAHRFDVIYATGLAPVAVSAGKLSNTPVVLKIVADAAWERASRLGLTRASFEQFQGSASGGPRLRAMRALRNWTARGATAVVAPSEHLARSIRQWAPGTEVVVVPNGARGARAGVNGTRRSPDSGLDLLFVGRLVAVKRVELLIEAAARMESTTLEIVGDGPEHARLVSLATRLGATDRISFTGVLDHEQVLRRVAAADALVLASSHEGLPHVVLEALVSGTPVVTSLAGGVTEVLTDEIDGLLVPDATPTGFAAAFARLEHDPTLLARLSEGAASTGLNWRFERCADRLEALMRSATKPPRAVFVARSRMSVPPRPDDVRKYELHGRHIRTVVVCPATRPGVSKPGGATVVGLPPLRAPLIGTALFYGVAPLVALAIASGRHQTAIVCQSPYEGAGVLALRSLLPRRLRPPVQVELHGDWRTATRLYGSPRRRWVSGAADRIGVWSLRHADRVRPVSEVLAQLARESGYQGPLDRFIAFSDYSMFLEPPTVRVPERANALFVGVLERPKGLDVLLEAWPDVLRALPGVGLTIVGAGSLGRDLEARIVEQVLGSSVRILEPMPRSDLRHLIDASSCLVLPSRSEGLPRIVLEAMARGRAIVASRVGGMEELVADGSNGRLVPAGDVGALSEALVEVLRERNHTEALGAVSRARAAARDPLREYETGIERMAEWISSS